MKDFGYAHNNTYSGERKTPTADFNAANLPAELEQIRLSACQRQIPVSGPETLNFLKTLLAALSPQNILEVGTAVGLSAAVMLNVCPNAHITTIENNSDFAAEARTNFSALGLENNIELIEADAAEALARLKGNFDFIFLDGPKAQYVKYLPDLKRILSEGGVLLADDVLLFGYVTGEEQTPKKRKMLVTHIKEYLSAVTSDEEFYTTVINIGNGLSLTVKKFKKILA